MTDILLQPNYTEPLGIASATFNPDAVDLFTSIQGLYMLGVMISIVAAGIMYMWAGFVRMQASHQAVTKSNAIIKRTTIGLLGVICFYAAVYTLNPDLLTGNVGLEKLFVKSPTSTVPSASTSTSTPSSGPSIPKNNDDPDGWNAIKNDDAIRKQLAALPNGGVTVNKKVCTVPTQTGCTTVGGWPPSTLTMLAELRSACGGKIQITGGTEAGHSSHGPGRRPADIGFNDDTLNKCIRSFPAGPSASFCYKTYQKFGFIFCDEINSNRHWHVY